MTPSCFERACTFSCALQKRRPYFLFLQISLPPRSTGFWAADRIKRTSASSHFVKVSRSSIYSTSSDKRDQFCWCIPVCSLKLIASTTCFQSAPLALGPCSRSSLHITGIEAARSAKACLHKTFILPLDGNTQTLLSLNYFHLVLKHSLFVPVTASTPCQKPHKSSWAKCHFMR